MTLDQWLSLPERSAHALHLDANVSAPVVARARLGRASYASARKIHLATGREVPIECMTSESVAGRKRTRKTLAVVPARAAASKGKKGARRGAKSHQQDAGIRGARS